MIYSLDGTSTRSAFPHPSEAETEPDGLLAVGGDLTIPRLITAYQSGIFPWYSKANQSSGGHLIRALCFIPTRCMSHAA